MAQKLDFFLNFNDLRQYVPKQLRNTVISGLLDNLFNRFMTRDESIPMYGYVGKAPSGSSLPKIPQPVPERDINSVLPVLNFSVGSEQYAYTTQDILKKAELVGISPGSLAWLYSQGNNFLPPIDIDKFTNFFNYYWIGQAVTSVPEMPWNASSAAGPLPEYYVIERPQPTDLTKLNARVSSGTSDFLVLTGSGFLDQTFTLQFTSETNFTVTPSASLIGPGGVYVPVTSSFSLQALPTSVPNPVDVTDVFTYQVAGPTGTIDLVQFKITRSPKFNEANVQEGYYEFSAGDEVDLSVKFLRPGYSLQVRLSPGIKPRISGVRGYSEYQVVDGVEVRNGDRVLIQGPASVSGIWIAAPGEWTRAPDFDASTWAPGAQVFVTQGLTNGGKRWESIGEPGAWGWQQVGTESSTNDWQEGNLWVKGTDLAALGLSRAEVIQAARPIIEYSSRLQLNSHVSVAGTPGDAAMSGSNYHQTKTSFNQLPLFDLFRYDGTHSGLVSSIFYYEEDPAAELDLVLQRRVKKSTNQSADFIFNHGCVEDGNLLFFKLDEQLKTVWHKGYLEAEVVDISQLATTVIRVSSISSVGTGNGSIADIEGGLAWTDQLVTVQLSSATSFSVLVNGTLIGSGVVGTRFVSDTVSFIIYQGDIFFEPGDQFDFVLEFPGTISVSIVNPATQQQVWTLTAEEDGTTFKVGSSKLGQLPPPFDTAVAGTTYNNGEITVDISLSFGQSYTQGDQVIIRVGALERPRYSFRNGEDKIVDVLGGPDADLDKVGAWQTPRTFIHNPYNENRGELLEGSLYSHFRSILQNQVPPQPVNHAFGGTIKLWSEQHTLLASLLMQKDFTPISMIDMSMRQYSAALNALRDLFSTGIVDYFSTNEVVTSSGAVDALLDALLERRALDQDVRTVLFDTTAGVIGFPATLPQLGMAELVEPAVLFDPVIRQDVLVHHDGHESPLEVDSQALYDEILGPGTKNTVVRSDGQVTPAVGSFTLTPPARPYKGELWLKPTGELLAFNVVSDTSTPPVITADNQFWYSRATNILYRSSGFTWQVEPDVTAPWVTVSFAAILNELNFKVEQRLFSAINPEQRKFNFSAVSGSSFYQEQLRRELFEFAARNNLDPLGASYIPQDAFTWNYSQAAVTNLPPISTSTAPARWYNLLMAHQATVLGVLPTESPHLEPWKLLGFFTQAGWVATLSQAEIDSYISEVSQIDPTFTSAGTVRAVSATPTNTLLAGLQTIDGVSLASGDVVLLAAEGAAANNGIWRVSTGSWSREGALVEGMYVTCTEGDRYAGSTWVLVDPVAVVNTSPVNFKQVRLWSDALWADIQAARPALRLSVNPFTDTLLPPYVTPSSALSTFALTTVIPPGISSGYQYGDGSPVEEVWTRSIEYGYARAKALFRFDPLAFLGFCWGFNWVQADGILYDGFDTSLPGHRRFRLHGEPVTTRHAVTNLTFDSASLAAVWPGEDLTLSLFTIVFTYDAYTSGQGQSFSVRRVDTGEIITTVREGIPQTITYDPVGLTIAGLYIEDDGRPFHVGDTFRLTVFNDGSAPVLSFEPATYHKILGFGQTFTNALRATSIDTQSSVAVQAFRGWDVNMGYRAGGLVATSDLKVFTESDSLSPASYTLLVKKNEGAVSLWLQALRISVLQYGTRAKVNGIEQTYPEGDGADWVFRVEGYNPRYVNLTHFTFPSDAARVTFYALDQSATSLVWTQPTGPTGETTVQLPITITGVQNTVDFLFGYVQWITAQGWELSSDRESDIDFETGRTRTWQLEIEKFIDQVYRGVEIDEGMIINPFQQIAIIRQQTGLLSEFGDPPLFDVLTHAAIYDLEGNKMRSSSISVTRGNLASSFSADSPMYCVHALLDEYEHLFIFNNYASASTQEGLLYDAFTGARALTYFFNGRQQGTGTFRPEFGGHYLVGNSVQLNLQAATDSLSDVYDANKVFQNELTTRHALALLGFQKKDYFTNLDITDRSQFNFWRGLIQAKGTNMSIDAYLNNGRFADARLDEYWAYKVAEYGDARQKIFPELRVQVDDVTQQFTLFQFDATTTPTGYVLEGFTQVSSFDENRWFTIDDLNQDVYFKAEVAGTFTRTFSAGDAPVQVKLGFIADELTTITGPVVQLNATTLLVTGPGTVQVTGHGPAVPRYSPLKLFNYVEAELIEEIPHWHPAAGQHTPTALEGINVISSMDPARYTTVTLTTNNPAYDPLRPWGDREVGRVWLDTRNLAYVPYYDARIFTNRAERLARWGTLADYATVDVYEWVKSPVPPREYDALAAVDEGNADLPAGTKASGQAALQEVYERRRTWRVNPVAWSYSPVPTDNNFGDKPPMKFSGDITGGQLVIDGASVWLNSGSFELLGIQVGDRIGTWLHGDDPAPLSEGTILNQFTQLLIDQVTDQPVEPKTITVAPLSAPPAVTVPFNATVTISSTAFPTTRYRGQLLITSGSDDPTAPNQDLVDEVQLTDANGDLTALWDLTYFIRITEVDTGRTFLHPAYRIRIGGTGDGSPGNPFVKDPRVTLVSDGDRFSYAVPDLGLTFTVTSTTSGTVNADFAVRAISQAFAGGIIEVKEAVGVSWLVPAPNGVYSNDPEDPAYALQQEVGWRAWSIPTQQELDADGRQPVSSWKPYVGAGPTVDLPYTELQAAVEYLSAPLTLNNGEVVQRYTTEWSDWAVVRNAMRSKTASADGSLEFDVSEFDETPGAKFDLTRTSVYVNGIAQLKPAYAVQGATLTVTNLKRGSEVVVVVRRYEPTEEELSFNPEVQENYSFQLQYKKDYQYVATQVRGTDITQPSSTTYYFWVKNKTTVATGKKLSIQAMARQLAEGPPAYVTFQPVEENGVPKLLGAGTASNPYRYDAISIAGLSFMVTQNDKFKLRFTRNFTLRDDPRELDLKDTHTEWMLLRPGQKQRIPERLWQKLTDSTAGQDAAGNQVPALRRVLYDERQGTKTQFGFGVEQTLAPAQLLRTSLSFTIVNTQLTQTTEDGKQVPYFIEFIDEEIGLTDIVSITSPSQKQQVIDEKVSAVAATFFGSPELVRATLTNIWLSATAQQVNELFFAALEDILASSFELTDIFKTSRLSLYSIQENRPGTSELTYE